MVLTDSDPFWLVFNYGLEEDDFETAVGDIAGVNAIPEPGFAGLMGLAALGAFCFRRRKQA